MHAQWLCVVHGAQGVGAGFASGRIGMFEVQPGAADLSDWVSLVRAEVLEMSGFGLGDWNGSRYFGMSAEQAADCEFVGDRCPQVGARSAYRI